MRKKEKGRGGKVVGTVLGVIFVSGLVGIFLSKDAISGMYQEKEARAKELPLLEDAFRKQIEAQRKLVRSSTTVGKEELDREQNPARIGEEALPNPFEPLPSDGQRADQ